MLFLRLRPLETLFSPCSGLSKPRTPWCPPSRVPPRCPGRHFLISRPPHEAAVATNATATPQLPKRHLVFTTWPSQKGAHPGWRVLLEAAGLASLLISSFMLQR